MKNPFTRNKQQQQSARSSDRPPTPVGAVKTQQYQQLWMPFAYLPRQYERQMGVMRNLDVSMFKYYSLNDILDILRNNHPETSFAIWQFLRVANSTMTCKAKKESGEDDKRGQKVLDALLWQLNHPASNTRFEAARGIELLAGQLFLNTMLRGGCGCELVLNQAGKMDRIQAFDAGTIYFQSDGNGRLIPFQKQTAPGTGFVNIDFPSVFYQPLDPATNDPYGTPPLASLIQIVVFQIQFMNDLLAAVHRVGYPRMTGKLIEEAFREQLPESVKNSPEQYEAAANAYLEATKDSLRNIDPDDYLVGWDSLEMSILAGSGQMIRVDAALKVIEQSITASLKTMLTILGRGENTSKESYAAEMKLFSRGIESVQKVVESLLERALTMALNLEGVRGWVDVEFAPVDLRSELQVVAELQTRQDIIITARMRGSISDYEEMKAHRNLLGFIGEPEGWEGLVSERKEREHSGGQQEDYPRHGSPPATQ